MNNLPVLFKARAIPHGDEVQLTAYSSDMNGFDVRVHHGVLYLSLHRDNVEKLSDLLIAFLATP